MKKSEANGVSCFFGALHLFFAYLFAGGGIRLLDSSGKGSEIPSLLMALVVFGLAALLGYLGYRMLKFGLGFDNEEH